MIVTVNNPIISTCIFTAILVIGFLFSIRKKSENGIFPLSVTQELKGLSILMIIFSHIGYFLVSDNRFLFPLSTMAGVGVNLFLFVSGYGLTASMQKKKLSIKEFYERHLSKLYVPFWIVIFSLFFLDFFVLHINYDLPYIARSALGFFPHSNLYQDVDSPLWYFTLIVF